SVRRLSRPEADKDMKALGAGSIDCPDLIRQVIERHISADSNAELWIGHDIANAPNRKRPDAEGLLKAAARFKTVADRAKRVGSGTAENILFQQTRLID